MSGALDNIFGGGKKDDSDALRAQLEKDRADAAKKKKELEDKLKAEDAGRRKGLRGIKSLLTAGETGFEKDKTKLGS